MVLISPAVAGFKFPRPKALQVLAKRGADQRRTAHRRPLGGSIRSAEERRMQYNLYGFHTVEYTPH